MASSDKIRSYPSTPDEIRTVKRHGFMLMFAAIVFMAVMTTLVHYETIKLHPSSVTEEVLKGFSARVEFTFRYQTLLACWLLFNVLLTIYGRLSRSALNPLDERTESRVTMEKNILTNSFESIVTSVFLQLIFVSFASPACILKCIPLINVLQFIGRITFYAGYPMFRAFGYNLTITPNIFLGVYNMYKFGTFLQLY